MFLEMDERNDLLLISMPIKLDVSELNNLGGFYKDNLLFHVLYTYSGHSLKCVNICLLNTT